MDAMELSLDDIIKAKKPQIKKPVHMRKKVISGGVQKRHVAPAAPIRDARLKLVEKNRAKIRDVREVINTRKPDARNKLINNMVQRMGLELEGRVSRAPMRRAPPEHVDAYEMVTPSYRMTRPAATRAGPMPKYLGAPRGYVDYDSVADTDAMDGRVPTVDSLDHLIANYVEPSSRNNKSMYVPSKAAVAAAAHHHPLHRHQHHAMDEDEEGGDAFDLYEAPSRTTRRPVIGAGGGGGSSSSSRTLSYEMKARLRRSPPPQKSMGIFANPTSSASSITARPAAGPREHQVAASKGYRVVVTNLHAEVTVWDIRELFADIGGLLSAEIIRPGVAEVVYRTLKDAEDAVEVYHNRQLDGMPMKCLLVNPTKQAPTPAAVGGGGGHSRRLPLEVDLDTVHSVLFKRH